jgi:hypothetical protein
VYREKLGIPANVPEMRVICHARGDIDKTAQAATKV